jgi:TIR domain
MGDNEQAKTVDDFVLEDYREIVETKHPSRLAVWPVLSGSNRITGRIGDHSVVIFIHTGNRAMTSISGQGELDPAVTGATAVTDGTRELVRSNLIRHFRLVPSDAVIFVQLIPIADRAEVDANIAKSEFEQLLLQHETVMDLAPNRIFLSHKGMDKPLVRDFHETLKLLGFDPWLDEDALTAGANREREILEGFNQSCAAVFFITHNFVDENYLATEIEYAIDQKRSKGDRFAIVTLSFSEGEKRGTVPQLIKSRYIYTEPSTRLEALREILRALPLRVGPIGWKF